MPTNPADPPDASPMDLDAVTSVHVRNAVEGDLESLGWVVARLSPLLLAQAAYRLGPQLRSVHDPEDLVNDAWAVALTRLGDLEPKNGRFTPVLLKFLSTTILFRVNNLMKRHLRAGAVGRLEPDSERPGESAVIDQLPAETSGAITLALRKELESTVARCLEALDARDREIILLRGIEQHPNHTVALLLGVSPQNVAMRYHRALKRLRARLPGSVFDEMTED